MTLQIIYRALADLKAHPANARTHSEAQVAQIAASMREFGATNPILVDEEGWIIAGHGRKLGAALARIDPYPTVTLAGLTPAQKRAYLIADNKIALGAGWDEDLLRQELGELRGMGFDLGLTGFELGEIEDLFSAGTPERDPEATPAAPVVPVTELGDVWILGGEGGHRLVCGDATNATDVGLALRGAVPHLMVTDPPYGVEYDAAWRNNVLRKDGSRVAARAVGKVLNDDRADWREAWALFPGDVAYVWHGGLHAAAVAESLAAAGFDIRSQIIWNKGTHIIGRGDYHWKHEPCWYAVRRGKPGHFNRKGAEGRTQNTVWDMAHRSSETGHSTQKPIDAMRRPIENNSKRGDRVYEPFAGSSTTIIAAQLTGRICHAIELLPAYVDVGVLRWQDFTGQDAILEATGQTFAQVKAERSIEI